VTTDPNDETTPDDGGGGDKDGDGLFAESVQGLFWSAVDRGAGEIISVLVHIALARILIPKHFGLVAMARVGVAFIDLFRDQGFEDAIVQRDTLEEDHIDVAFWTLLGLGIVLTGLGTLASPLIAWFFQEPKLEYVFFALVLMVPISSTTSLPNALLKRDMRFKILSIRSLFAVLVGGSVAIGLALTLPEEHGVWALVGKTLSGVATEALVLWIAVDWRPSLNYSVSHFKDLFSFGVNITGARIVNYFNRQLDDILIGRFLGSELLGYYSVAYEILRGMTTLLSRTVSSVAMPAFAKLQNDMERMREAFIGAVKTSSVVAFPFFFLFIGVAPELMHLAYGPKWEPAIPVARILAAIGILQAVTLINPPLIKACNKPSWEFGLSALNTVGNVIGFSIAVQYGIMEVAIAYVLRGYLVSPVKLWAVHTLLDYRVSRYLKVIGFAVFGCLLMLGTVFGLKALLPVTLATGLRLGLLMTLGFATYGAYIYLRLPDSDWEIIDRIIGELRQELGLTEESKA
jgi:PST family polysaccharide transporter